jgi:hypothetical protein
MSLSHSLINDAVSSSENTASDDKVVNELRIGLNIQGNGCRLHDLFFRNLPGRIEEIHQTPQLAQQLSGFRATCVKWANRN